jgi:hypothetical protein
MSRDPRDLLAWTLYARAALGADDLETTLGVLAAIRKNNQATAETMLLDAFVELRRGNNEAAMAAAEDALRMDAELASARQVLEQAAAAAGNTPTEKSRRGLGS